MTTQYIKSDFPLNQMYADHVGYTATLLFKDIGINIALTFIFSYLREHIPITRIFCGFRKYENQTYTTIADTWEGAHHKIRSLPTSQFTENEIELMMGCDTFEPYIINNATVLSNENTSLREEDLASYLRIPLFSMGESKFHIAFCSNIQDTFTIELADLLVILTKRFGEALQHRFTHSDKIPTLNKARIENSAVARLELCSGLHDVLRQIEKVAKRDCSVLIMGETGTGKEIVADAIQELSDRRNGAYIKVNCGAIPENLIDSEFFGHEKGSFTGAMVAHKGHFESANNGTILLDEIGEIPLPLQARLLRVLDRKTINRVGSSKSYPVDIRVIAATHRDLMQMISENTFREDLWYRLNVFTIFIPPLRSRRMDIPPLAELFIQEKANNLNIFPVPELDREQEQQLLKHNWFGNVRQLENVIERSLIEYSESRNFDSILEFSLSTLDNNYRFREKQTSANENDSINYEQIAQANSFESTPAKINQWLSLDEVIQKHISETLKFTSGKIGGKNGAAKLLKVHPNTLYNKKSG